MKIQGKLDFNANNVFNFVLEPYDGSVVSFPTENITPGRIIFRTDNMQVYVCVSNNPIVWQPIIKVADFYEHTQDVNSSLWLINHNLGTSSVIVQVYDTSNNQVIPEEITISDENNVNISFGQMTMAGRAFVISLNTNIGTFVDRMSLSIDVLKSKLEITNVVYDTNDNPTSVSYSDGFTAEISYTDNKDVDTLTFKNSVNQIVEQWKYNYDVSNRLISTNKLV